MILFAHMLFGAAIGYVVNNMLLAVILAFFGHYFLDLFPHIEYSIDNIRNKNWKKSLFDISKVIIDFCLAILIIFILSKNYFIIYLCALVAVIPDGFTIISSIFSKLRSSFNQKAFIAIDKTLKQHDWIHTIKIHFLKYKKISNFWRITTQVIAIIISIAILKN